MANDTTGNTVYNDSPFPALVLIVQHLRHIRTLQLIPKPPIIIPRPHPRNNGDLPATVFLAGDALCLFHEEGADALVLEDFGVAAVHLNGGAVDVLRQSFESASTTGMKRRR